MSVSSLAAPPVTTWSTAILIRDIDGDTAVLHLARTTPGEDWDVVVASPAKGTRGRLVWVNTPDLPDAAAKAAGTADTAAWFDTHRALGADSYGRDEYGRLLVDVWPIVDGVPHRDASLSRWLLTSGNGGKGWPPYGGTRPPATRG